MTASTCRHADRPLAFTVSIGEKVHIVRAHRIHPVGQVLDGSRSGSGEPAEAVPGDLDDDSWGHDVCDRGEGLMAEPPRIRRRQRLVTARAASYHAVAQG